MRVQLGDHLLAIDAPTVTSGPTRRPAAVVAWSANDKAFALIDGKGRAFWRGRAVLIPANFSRGLRAIDCDLISLSLEPGHPLHRGLARMAGDRVRTLSVETVAPYSTDLQLSIQEAASTDLGELTTDLGHRLLAGMEDPGAHPTWVQAALDRLDDPDAACNSSPEPGVARALGLPVRSYLIWRRFRRALAALQTGADLTTVAHDVGFYDLAQMSRTFMTYYGYPPSRLRRPDVLQIVN